MKTTLILLINAALFAASGGVLERVDSHSARFGALSRQIWETPELGFQEARSSSLLEQELRANGFTVQAGVAGMPTAFTASWGSGAPIIVLLGEYDALPGLSQKDIPVQEPVQANAPGHGCGHNLLGTASALAAVAIKEEMQARSLKGTVRFYGTPAEEGGGGKIYMIHAGLFRNVDAVLTWHPGDSNSVSVGSCLANNGGRFRFYGTASHAAAAPDRGRSALDGVMIMLNAVEFLREHVSEKTRIHYIISNGGSAANVVPAFAEVSLIARHPDAQVLDGIWERIMNCARAGALASDTRMEFVQGTNYANILPNDALAALLSRSMKKAGGYSYSPEESRFAETIRKSLGDSADHSGPESIPTDMSDQMFPASTDVGDVSWVVPTAQFDAATFVPGTAYHTWQAAACAGTSIGRKGMLVAARTLALAGTTLFENPAEVKAAHDSFEKRRAGRTWQTHIPADAKPPVSTSAK